MKQKVCSTICHLRKKKSAWSSLLAASRIHGDLERGVNAANHYLDLEPNDAAAHVMLSSFYVAAGR